MPRGYSADSFGGRPFLTRRSLLRVGALSPLIIPGRSLARVGGAPAVVTGPCGSPTPVFTSNATEIIGPGCYALQNDITDIPALSTMGGLTILGNGHSVTPPPGNFFKIGFGLNAFVHTIRDLTVTADGIEINGNVSTTQTSPCVYLYNVTMNATGAGGTGSVGSLVHMSGSNIVLEKCAINTWASGGTTGYDDGVILSPFSGVGNVPASYVTFDTVTFGPNWDVAIEGFSTQGTAVSPHWNHVTIKNCVTTFSPFSVAGADFGGYYGGPNSGDLTFTFQNGVFTGNTLKTGGWFFANAAHTNYDRADSDAAANGLWAATGNAFGANTYLALTREQCEARAKLWAANRRNPPPGPPPEVWNEKIICP
jgi:hypothetical protein